jgi:DNA mismatch endonuclease (patch repair protein)
MEVSAQMPGEQRDASSQSHDFLSPAERSERMSRVHGKDTKIEMKVRRLVHGMGYRYRLHSGRLPGRPDMVFPGRKKVIFVHGCFWHLHEDCSQYRQPKSRRDFWMPKLEQNRARDMKNQEQLRGMGWGVLVIWECELKHPEALSERIKSFLEG